VGDDDDSAGVDDADGDGWPAGDDCDDADPAVHPGAPEICDGVADNDCGSDTNEHGVAAGDSIQDAIDAATDGDLVCVEAGTYHEDIDLGGKAVQVVGVEGPRSTTIRGTGATSVVTIASGEGLDTVLAGFTVRGGDAGKGGGVYVSNASPTLSRLEVTGNNASTGGCGIAVEHSSAVLSHVQVSGQACPAWGAGIYLHEMDGTLDNVSVASNTTWGMYGGGMFVSSSAVTMTHVEVSGNYSEEDGGGILVSGGAPALENLLVTGNEAYWGTGGGIYFASAGSVSNAVIHGNWAYRYGGGLFVDDGPTLTNLIVTENTGYYYGGGGIYGSATVSYCDVWANSPDDYGVMADPTGADGNVSASPGFQALSYRLAPSSTLIDAGDPARLDPDGSPSDMGAFGGEHGGAWDMDGDGYPAWWQPTPYDHATYPDEGWDCDDANAAVHPGSGC